jgi:hypothetical protein
MAAVVSSYAAYNIIDTGIYAGASFTYVLALAHFTSLFIKRHLRRDWPLVRRGHLEDGLDVRSVGILHCGLIVP